MTDRKQMDMFTDTEYVASATECTGIMPAFQELEDQNENIADLYAIHEPKAKKKK